MQEFDLEHEIDSDMDDLRYDAISNLTDEDIEEIRKYKLNTRDLAYD